jgi:hypothetical protein
MTTTVAVGIALAVTLAACTTEQTSDPAPTLTSTTSTTTTTTTTEPPPAPTVPETSVTTTTEPPAPSGPVDAVVPVFAGGDEGGWLFLGSWQFDAWAEPVDADGEPVDPSIGAGTAASVVDLDDQRAGTFGEPALACFDDRTGPTVDVTVAAPDPPGFGYAAIALPQPAWDLTPRPVAVSASAPAAYTDLGVAAFAGDPVDASLGSVQQLVVTDLDGDGDDEALVAFEYVQPSAGPGAGGDLSGLLLVDTVTRQASTVERSFVDADLGPDEFPLIERYRVLAVADLNGDGRTEVAVHAWYYEGASVIVYGYDGAELTEVLANGCGA